MNHIELILENIRLGHIEKLLQESTNQEELQRGVNLINESMQILAELLEADGWMNPSGSTWADEVKPKDKIATISDNVSGSAPAHEADFSHIPGESASTTPVVKPRVLNANRPSFAGSAAPVQPRRLG